MFLAHLYQSIGRAIVVTMASVTALVKVLVKVLKWLYLLNFWIEVVHTCPGLGPVVQSVVSLTSSLRVILLTVLADSICNILIFFAEKM